MKLLEKLHEKIFGRNIFEVSFEYLEKEYNMVIVEKRFTSRPKIEYHKPNKSVLVWADYWDDYPIRVDVYDGDPISLLHDEDHIEFFKEFPPYSRASKHIDGYIKTCAEIFYEILKQNPSLLNE